MIRLLILVLITFLTMCPTLAMDPDGPSLPSRNPSVVIVLLKGYRSYQGPATIIKILGNPEADTIVKDHHERLYNLEDGTIIRVRESDTKVYSIFLQNYEVTKIQVIYALNKKWRRP